jgi:hypothetical protein
MSPMRRSDLPRFEGAVIPGGACGSAIWEGFTFLLPGLDS